jgi:hypothetical protein
MSEMKTVQYPLISIFFGIGYYYLKISDRFPGILRARLGFDHEPSGEIYYNIQVAPWLYFTPDLQIVGSA